MGRYQTTRKLDEILTCVSDIADMRRADDCAFGSCAAILQLVVRERHLSGSCRAESPSWPGQIS